MECSSMSLTKTKVLQTCSCSVEQKCLMLLYGTSGCDYSVISQSTIQQKRGNFPQNSNTSKVNPNVCHVFLSKGRGQIFFGAWLVRSKYLRGEVGWFQAKMSTVEYLEVNPLLFLPCNRDNSMLSSPLKQLFQKA